MPFQFSYDSGYGPNDGDKAFVNVQPVIPFSLNDDWNVISRTILPIASSPTWISGWDEGLTDRSQPLASALIKRLFAMATRWV